MRSIKIPTVNRYGNTNWTRLDITDTEEYTKKTRGNLLNNIAKTWGEVQRTRTIINNDKQVLKNYSCSSHGGYILFSTEPIKGLVPRISKKSFTGNVATIVPFYVYLFEEDCDWALLYLISTDKSWAKIQAEWSKAGGKGELKEHAIKTIDKHHKVSVVDLEETI